MTKFSEGVIQSSTISGTGPYILVAPPTGAISFVTAFGDGALVPYRAQNQLNTAWEERYGTVVAGSPAQLTRGTFIRSSTGTSIIWPDASPKYIFNLPQASMLDGLLRGNKGPAAPIWLEAGGDFIDDTVTPWIDQVSDGGQLVPRGYIDPAAHEYMPALRRNLLYNGGFQIAQRGAGPFGAVANGSYTLDGAIYRGEVGGVLDIARVASADTASGYAAEITILLQTLKAGLLLPIEADDARQAVRAGKCSLQFKAKRTSGTSVDQIRAHVLGWSGAADAITNPVSAWNGTNAAITPAANWTLLGHSRFTLGDSIQTFRLPDLAVGGSYTNLAVLLVVDETTATLGHKAVIGDVKLEAGQFCTPFVSDSLQAAELRCLRYYWTLGGEGSNEVVGPGLAYTTVQARVPLIFPVPMRVAPAVAVSAAAHWFVTIATGNLACNGFNVSANESRRSVMLQPTVASGLTLGTAVYMIAANGSARLTFAAEL